MFSCEFWKISKNTFSYRTPPVAASDFLKTNISLSHLLISIIIDIFDFLRCFIDIIHKYKFHAERVQYFLWT